MVTIKQKKAFKIVGENGGNISKAMAEAGYSITKPNVSTDKLTNSNGWKELMEQHLPDKLLAKKHRELLEQKELAYFVFSKDKKDDEIEGHMKANGLDLIVIRHTDKGKMAFYSIDNSVAKKNGLEMAYKLKGHFQKEGGGTNVAIQVNVGEDRDKFK